MQDENGTGLLHKAVYYNHRDIADWLMDKYPESMSVRDNVSRKLVQDNVSRKSVQDNVSRK